MNQTPDVSVINEGSIVMLHPNSQQAKTWLESNCLTEPWQWMGDSLCVEPRMAGDIIDGLIEEGYSVGMAV